MKRTVLLIDGSSSMLYYNGILMKRLQYAVLTAAKPEDALHLMANEIPSAILMATTFPRMSGLDFMKTMKSDIRLKDVPIVILTGDKSEANRAACLSLGCAAYLTKPVHPYHIFNTIQAATEHTQRQHVRLKTSLKTIVGNGAATGVEYATSISEGGLFLRTLFPRPIDEIIPVQLFINDTVINAKASVLYTYTLGKGAFKEPGMGMKFVEISPEDRDFLRSLILDQLTNDIEQGEKKESTAEQSDTLSADGGFSLVMN